VNPAQYIFRRYKNPTYCKIYSFLSLPKKGKEKNLLVEHINFAEALKGVIKPPSHRYSWCYSRYFYNADL